MDQKLEEEFKQKYQKQCKRIETDLKVKLCQVPRYLISPTNESQAEESVKNFIKKHSTANTFRTGTSVMMAEDRAKLRS